MKHINFFLLILMFMHFKSFSQNCALTVVQTNHMSTVGSTCQYATTINFSASNSNTANSVNITTGNGSIESITNPGLITDASPPFTFTNNFVGNYVIYYYVPCSQRNIDFNFQYDGPGNGDCNITSPLVNLAPLPIKIEEYGYKKAGQDNIIYWTTSEEYNSYGYYIYKSENAEDFIETDFIPSRKESGTKTYTWTVNSKTNAYYKLEQEDFDGTRNTLGVVFVPASENLEKYFIQSNHGQEIKVGGIYNETINVELIDLSGRIILQQKVDEYNQSINTSDIYTGTYLLKLSGEKGLVTKPIFISQ